MLLTKKMPSFDGVAAGQTATVSLPIGLSYHELLLTYSGATLAEINEIRVVANGQTIQRYTEAADLDLKNQFDGQAAANGVLNIPVGDRYGLKTRAGVEFTKLGTGRLDDPKPITSLQLEVDIDAAAVGPALSLSAIQSDADQSGIIKFVHEFIYNPSAAGEFEISDLPKGRDFGQLIFQSTNINSIEIFRDGFSVWKRTKAENDKIQGDGVRIPQAGIFVVDFTEKGYGSESLVTKGVQDLRFRLDMAGADTVPLVVESYGPMID